LRCAASGEENAMNRQFTQNEIQPLESNLRQLIESNSSYENLPTIAALREDNQLALFGDDELLTSLSNAYENRRARQVFEWEKARRRVATFV
jgi:hypothetical protein